jgi:outer membrane immunogenic protein
VGLEGDWDWTDPHYSICRQTTRAAPGAGCVDVGQGVETVGGETKWLATFRGRVGVTTGNWLFYGTGGAAWGDAETDISLSCLVGGCGHSVALLAASVAQTTIKSGWVSGLGAEWMATSNWSLRAEWLHIDLGTISGSLPTAGSVGVQTAIWSRTERYDEIRGGLSYLFR